MTVHQQAIEFDETPYIEQDDAQVRAIAAAKQVGSVDFAARSQSVSGCFGPRVAHRGKGKREAPLQDASRKHVLASNQRSERATSGTLPADARGSPLRGSRRVCLPDP